jgi:predicted hotdog family 3-hydroxylacyl-ACP dehydratase
MVAPATRPRLLRRVFLVFNGAMGAWFLVSLADAVARYAGAESDSVRTGTLVGTGLGLGALLVLWGAGAALLGPRCC